MRSEIPFPVAASEPARKVIESELSAYCIVQGGGIWSTGGLVTVSGSTFSGNTPDSIFGSYLDGGGNTGL